MVVNGQYQVERGPEATQKTIEVLQKVIKEISKPDFSDYYSKALFKDDE